MTIGKDLLQKKLNSIKGVVEISKENCKITKINNDYDKQYLNVDNFCEFLNYEIDQNFETVYSTDAFYWVESVKVKYKAVVNNVEKEFTNTMHPDLFGKASVELKVAISDIYDIQYNLTNAFLIEYK